MSLSDTWLVILIGGSFAFTASCFIYTWIVQAMVAKAKDANAVSIGEARKDMLDAISKQNEMTQRTTSNVSSRTEMLLAELRNDSAVARAALQREMADHALEDSRIFATKTEMSEALGEVRSELRSINVKLDRVIERNNHIDRP